MVARLFSSNQDTAKDPQPVVLKEEFCLYESTTNLDEAIDFTRRKFVMGGCMGGLGFLSVVATVAPSLPSSTMLCLVAASVGNGFLFFRMSQRMIRSFVMKHVEEIAIMPTDVTARAGIEANLPYEDTESATDSLDATEELQLRIRCANLERMVTITDPTTAWGGARYAGLVSDNRISLNVVFNNLKLMHVEPETGKVGDKHLLEAIVNTSKIISAEEVKGRSDVETSLQMPTQADGTYIFPGAHLMKVDIPQDSKVPTSVATDTPVNSIKSAGNRAFTSGALILVAGTLFLKKKMQRQPESEANR